MGTKNYNFTYINEPNHKRTDLVPETTLFLDQIDDALSGVDGKNAVTALGNDEEGGNVTVKGYNRDGEEVARTTFAVGGSTNIDIIAPLKTGAPAVSSDGVAVGRGCEAQVDALAVGDYSNAHKSSISIGRDSSTADMLDIALGQQAKTRAASTEREIGSVALGALSTVSEDGVVSVGSEEETRKRTRRIVNVSDPVGDSDAATKKYVDDHAGGSDGVSTIEVASGSYNGSMVVTGKNSAGTAITSAEYDYGTGFVQELAGNYDTGMLYLQAIGVQGAVLSDLSIPISAGVGGEIETVSPSSAEDPSKVAQSYSEAPYQSIAVGSGSQATAIYSTALGNDAIATVSGSTALGHGAKAGGTLASGVNCVAIGNNSNASGSHTVAIGRSSLANGENSVALGSNSIASASNVVSVGSGYEGSSFPQPGYRRIINVATPTGNHDAATKAYVDGKPTPAIDSPTAVDTYSFLNMHGVPKWSNGSFRNAGWMVSNSALEAKTIPAGTVFATGMSLKANQTASVLVLPSGDENTLKTGDTGKSVFFSADFEMPANSTVTVMILDEVF